MTLEQCDTPTATNFKLIDCLTHKRDDNIVDDI